MEKRTFISGKDSALEDSIAYMQAQLKRHGFNIEEVSWLNPVPHVWSVHLRDMDCPACFTNGKGNTRKAALASALGEFIERLTTNFFWADYWLGNTISASEFVHYPHEQWFPLTETLGTGFLDKHTRKVYNYNNELNDNMLVDLNSCNEKRGVCTLPFRRQRNGETVYFPVNIIDNLYVSNGMAAGNTQDESIVQALSEIIERAIKNKIIKDGLSLPDIPDSTLSKFPQIIEGVKSLQNEGFKLYIKDASLGGVYPLINITLLNPENGGCYAAFGAHPDMGVAVSRTFTELLQGRSLNQLDIFPEPSFNLQETSDPQNLETHFIDSSGIVPWKLLREEPDFEYTDWSMSTDNKSLRKHLTDLLHNEGYEVYIAEYNHIGLPVCRIIVPGFSEIYPIDDLNWNNNNQGIHLREPIMSLPDLTDIEIMNLLENIEEGDFHDNHPVSALTGLIPDPDSPLHDLTISELKALLYLSVNYIESALAEIEITLHTGYPGKKRSKRLRCLKALLKIKLQGDNPDKFRNALISYFGPDEVTRCLKIVRKELKFDGFISLKSARESVAHEKLIRAYEKNQVAKLSAIAN